MAICPEVVNGVFGRFRENMVSLRIVTAGNPVLAKSSTGKLRIFFFEKKAATCGSIYRGVRSTELTVRGTQFFSTGRQGGKRIGGRKVLHTRFVPKVHKC